jgi:putative endonuclease
MWSPSKVFNKRAKGDAFEKVARHHLERQGLKLVAQNVNFKGGEIDLIMKDDAQLVFIEVRFRQSKQFGGAAASVAYKKQQRIILAAQLYLQKHFGNRPPSCRFDVVAIDGEGHDSQLTWLKNAFA